MNICCVLIKMCFLIKPKGNHVVFHTDLFFKITFGGMFVLHLLVQLKIDREWGRERGWHASWKKTSQEKHALYLQNCSAFDEIGWYLFVDRTMHEHEQWLHKTNYENIQKKQFITFQNAKSVQRYVGKYM